MITEEMLRIAAAEADQAIRDSLPHPADCDHQFSPRFERKMKRVIRRGRHPVAYKFLHRAACLLVVVTLVGASWLTVDAEPSLHGCGSSTKTLWNTVSRDWRQMKK